MKQTLIFITIVCALIACASASSPVYVLDPANNNMRAHDPKNDRPLSDCNAEKLPSGEVLFKCVSLFNADYVALTKQIADLTAQLKECQANH